MAVLFGYRGERSRWPEKRFGGGEAQRQRKAEKNRPNRERNEVEHSERRRDGRARK